MKAKLFVVIMLVPMALAAGGLKLVAKVPYEELRYTVPLLDPDYDYGEAGVELWADLDSDCFETQTDVLDLFQQWLAVFYSKEELPKVLEMHCRPAGPDSSLAAIAEMPVHGSPPNRLRVFTASSHGRRTIQILFDARMGGSLLFNPYLGFIEEDGRAVGILYCDQSVRDENGLGCDVVTIDGKKEGFYCPALYKIERHGERKYLAVVGIDQYRGWAIQRIGRAVTTVAELKATPESLPKDMVGAKAARELDAVQAFLVKLDALVKQGGAVKVFDSGYLRRYAKILKARELMNENASDNDPPRSP